MKFKDVDLVVLGRRIHFSSVELAYMSMIESILPVVVNVVNKITKDGDRLDVYDLQCYLDEVVSSLKNVLKFVEVEERLASAILKGINSNLDKYTNEAKEINAGYNKLCNLRKRWRVRKEEIEYRGKYVTAFDNPIEYVKKCQYELSCLPEMERVVRNDIRSMEVKLEYATRQLCRDISRNLDSIIDCNFFDKLGLAAIRKCDRLEFRKRRERAEILFNDMKHGRVSPNKYKKIKGEVAELWPLLSGFCEWLWAEADDKKGEENELATAVCVDLRDVKRKELDKRVGKLKSGIATEELAIEYRKKVIVAAQEIGFDPSLRVNQIDDALKHFDKCARTVFGIEYPSREEARNKRGDRNAFFAGVRMLIKGTGEDSFYLGESIPVKKKHGAGTYLTKEQYLTLFALLDTTVFGSAKDGMSFTEWGIVWHGGSSLKYSYSWKELGQLKSPIYKDKDIFSFDKDVIYDNLGSNVPSNKLFDILEKCREWAAVATFDWENKETLVADSHWAIENNQNNCIFTIFTSIKSDAVFCGNDIPPKKRNNAFVSMCIEEAVQDIVVLVDATVFGSAKDGLVVTDKAIYFKNIFETPVRIPLEAIEEVAAEGTRVKINGKYFIPSVFDKKTVTQLVVALKSIKPRKV